ncbi:MAG: thermonuclease family protein [Patescibacteria group bacterium]
MFLCKKTLGIFLLCLLSTFSGAYGYAKLEKPVSLWLLRLAAGGERPVVHVADGDTIRVSMRFGKDRSIRLLGIDTPETVDPRRPGGCFGQEASAKTKEVMSGKSVRLEFDDSADTLDDHGRLIAYVWLPDGKMLNRLLIDSGYAFEYTYRRPYSLQKDFRGAEAVAKVKKVGLWGVCGPNPKRKNP